MAFGDNLEALLPSYLVNNDKERLKKALSQFVQAHDNKKEIDYSNFYHSENLFTQFMQTDMLSEIRYAHWHNENGIFEKMYTDAIIISNSCDISPDNKRDLNKKECLFAPIIDFQEFLTDLSNEGQAKDKIQTFANAIRSQMNTNTFYLPPSPNTGKDYIVLLDQIFTFPTQELNTYLANIDTDKIESLTHFGYYLFILKLSYHLCRLPEELDR